MSRTPSAYKRLLQTRINLLQEIIDGLDGKPFEWGDGERTSKGRILKELNITLVTKTWLKKNGYMLNPRAKPVGTAYFGSPISNYGEVYVLECQAVKIAPGENNK